MMLLYTCWIIFMFNQRPDFGRESVGFLDATLNKQIGKGMHTYDDDCAFDISLIWSEMDHYYLVHWCDWILASIVIRDPYILHFWHLFNEVIELSFQHRLPHFRECWWDHIILDILLSNIPAVTLGLWIVDKVGMRRYDWLGRAGKESFWDWEIWQCHRRYGNVVLSLVLLTFHFVDGFFIMNAFLIPPVHPFPPSRMLLWFFYGAIAYRECFVDIETWNTPGRQHHPVESRYRWLASAVLVTEALVAYKYREGTGHIADTPTPWYIWYPWLFGLLALGAGWLKLRFKEGATQKYPNFPEGAPAEPLIIDNVLSPQKSSRRKTLDLSPTRRRSSRSPSKR